MGSRSTSAPWKDTLCSVNDGLKEVTDQEALPSTKPSVPRVEKSGRRADGEKTFTVFSK